MKKKTMLRTVSVLCLMGVLAVGLAACGSQKGAAPSTKKVSATKDTKKEAANKIEKFETMDLQGNKVTREVFKENQLTMVNLFSSTCNPCMEELPHLADLANEYKDKKVGILGINIDLDAKGKPDEESKKAVLQILGKKKSTMKIAFWDENLKNMLHKKTDALPYTFFVDKDGNIVGEENFGARSKADWGKIIDAELKKMSQK